MGYNPQVYLFDYNKYMSYLVPAFHKLLLNGELEPGLTQIYSACMTEALDYGYREEDTADTTSLEETLELIKQPELYKYCTFVNLKDLALADYARYANDLLSLTYMRFFCESASCPLRTTCFMHKNQNPENAAGKTLGWHWGINYTLETALLEHCADNELKHSLGRSYRLGLYYEHFKHAGFEAYTHPAYILLAALSGRGGALGFGDMGEGLLGWLDPAETVEFVGYLNQLAELAPVQPTFEVLQTAFTDSSLYDENKPATLDRFASLSLGVLRALGLMAIERGQGLVLQAW